MAAMSAVEVRDRLADRFRLLQGSTPGPERQLTLRHAVEWSYDLLTDDERDAAPRHLGVRRRLRPGEHLAPSPTCSDDVDVLRHLDSLVRKSLVVADHTTTRTRYSLFETIRQFAEDRLARAGELERDPRPARRATSRARPAPGGSAGTDRAGATPSTGSRPSSATCAPRSGGALARGEAGGGDRHRRARRADGVLGAAVRDARVGRGAARPAAARPTSADSPASTPRAGYACFAGRAEAARANAHRATELEDDARYDPCEPGYAIVRRGARPGLLRRPRPLHRADRRGGAALRQRPRLRPRRPTSTASSRRAGSRRRWRSPRSRSPPRDGSATRTGSPTRCGSPGWRSRGTNARRALAAWDEGVAFVREHRVQFFEGFLARDAARLHTSDGEPDVALGAVRRSDRRLPPRRQRAAADHHARERSRAVRAARPSRACGRCCSARCRASRRASTTSPSSPSSATGSRRRLGTSRTAS